MLRYGAMNRMIVSTAFVVPYVLSASAVSAAPEPGLAARTWEVDITFYDPQRITLRLPGDSHDTTLWYVLFTVTNNTGKDIDFYPSSRIVTDTLRVVEGGADVSPAVYDAIFARYAKEYPFMASPAKITGPLLQGEENARTSAVVFRTFDKEASGFTLFFSGLSGDVRRVANPSFDAGQPESDDNPRFFVLRRTLAVEYELPGDEETSVLATPVRKSRRWVMR